MRVDSKWWYRNINLFTIAYCRQSTALGLEIDLPWADEPSPGNRRFSADKILTCLFATYADILTSISSITPHDVTSTYNRTLPYQFIIAYKIRSFGDML